MLGYISQAICLQVLISEDKACTIDLATTLPNAKFVYNDLHVFASAGFFLQTNKKHKGIATHIFNNKMLILLTC